MKYPSVMLFEPTSNGAIASKFILNYYQHKKITEIVANHKMENWNNPIRFIESVGGRFIGFCDNGLITTLTDSEHKQVMGIIIGGVE